jgi:glycerol uptake facilitator-like aquaporin
MCVYIAGQFVGAILGYAALFYVTPTEIFYSNSTASGLCVNVMGRGVTPFQGFVVEFIITAILVFVRLLMILK